MSIAIFLKGPSLRRREYNLGENKSSQNSSRLEILRKRSITPEWNEVPDKDFIFEIISLLQPHGVRQELVLELFNAPTQHYLTLVIVAGATYCFAYFASCSESNWHFVVSE